MSYEKERIWRIGDGKWENKEFDVTNAATTVYCYFKDSGTDDSNDTTKIYKRYYTFGRGAYHINLRPSAIITIVAAKLSDGTLITFSDPITVGVTGYARNFGSEIDYIVLETQAGSTNIKLEAN